MISTIFSVPGDSIAVSISPGAMALTRMPRGAEIGGHLARQRGERRLRGCIGGAGEGMHARAGDRGDVDHGALGGLELVEEPAREHDRREEVHLEYVMPIFFAGIDEPSRLPSPALGEMAALLTSACNSAVEPPLDFGDRLDGVGCVGEVDLDVIFRAGLPRTIFGERMP